MRTLRTAAALLVLAAVPALAQPGYVAFGASGGTLGDATDPFPSLSAALAAGADELRIASAFYPGDVVVTTDVPFRTWNGESGASEALDVGAPFSIVGDLHVDAGATMTIVGSGIGFTVTGDLDLEGALDIQENLLAINGRSPANELRVGTGGDLVSTDVGGRTGRRDHAGLILFNGDGDTDVYVETTAGRLRFDFPAIRVDRGSGGVTFTGNGVSPAGGDDRLDVLGTPAFTLNDPDSNTTNGPHVDLLEGLDLLDVGQYYQQAAGEFLMSGVCSSTNPPQQVRTGGALAILGGSFTASGCRAEAGGTFQVGDADESNGDARFTLGFGGYLLALGDLIVQPDGDYRQGFGDAGVSGDFTFLGVGDGAGSGNTGIFGDVYFIGDALQVFRQSPSPDAYLDDVIVDGAGIVLESDAWMNEFGVLTLANGIIDTRDEAFDWIFLNPGIEEYLTERNSSERNRGVIQLGSRDSYISAETQREVRLGNDSGGLLTGGYLFPCGAAGEERDAGPSGEREVDFFRPLLLQFPDDLGQPTRAGVNCPGTDPGVDHTPIETDGLLLDRVGDTFWKLKFSQIHGTSMNVRVGADMDDVFGTPGGRRVPTDLNDVRIVQWDCDGSNPRLAGTYVGDAPGTALRVAEIDGLGNVSQVDVEVDECALFGLATNSDNLPPTDTPEGPAAGLRLDANVPNPFDGTTEIGFALAAASEAQLVVFDVLGRAVRTLAAGPHTAGDQRATWDGRDGSGNRAAAGVYVVRLDVGGATRSRTMVLVR